MCSAHQFDPTILREYDIRGSVGQTLTDADARAIGRGFGSMLRARGGQRAALGCDGRLSSPRLHDAVTEGLRAAGVDRIACLSVNDAHVMKAWGDIHGTDGKIDMIADPHAEFARALGLAVHMGPILGERATRCAMIIDDGVLTKMMMEEVGAYEVSSPTHVITQL